MRLVLARAIPLEAVTFDPYQESDVAEFMLENVTSLRELGYTLLYWQIGTGRDIGTGRVYGSFLSSSFCADSSLRACAVWAWCR